MRLPARSGSNVPLSLLCTNSALLAGYRLPSIAITVNAGSAMCSARIIVFSVTSRFTSSDTASAKGRSSGCSATHSNCRRRRRPIARSLLYLASYTEGTENNVYIILLVKQTTPLHTKTTQRSVLDNGQTKRSERRAHDASPRAHQHHLVCGTAASCSTRQCPASLKEASP
jgi:hypothetical protein